MVETDWSRWLLYGAGWFLLILGGRAWARQLGKPIPLAYILLVGLLIILQIYAEFGF